MNPSPLPTGPRSGRRRSCPPASPQLCTAAVDKRRGKAVDKFQDRGYASSAWPWPITGQRPQALRFGRKRRSGRARSPSRIAADTLRNRATAAARRPRVRLTLGPWKPAACSQFMPSRGPAGIRRLASLLVYPLMDDTPTGRVAFGAVALVVVPLAVWMVNSSPSVNWIAWLLALPAMLLSAPRSVRPSRVDHDLVRVRVDAVFLCRCQPDLVHAARSPRHRRRTVRGRGTFTLLAWGFAYAYYVCQEWYPDSFTGMVDPHRPRRGIELLFLSDHHAVWRRQRRHHPLGTAGAGAGDAGAERASPPATRTIPAPLPRRPYRRGTTCPSATRRSTAPRPCRPRVTTSRHPSREQPCAWEAARQHHERVPGRNNQGGNVDIRRILNDVVAKACN